MSPEQADALLRAAARLFSLDPEQVWRALQNPEASNAMSILEMACSRCLRADDDQANELGATIDRAARRSRCLWIFDSTFPLFLLDDDLAHELLTERVRQSAPNQERALARLCNEVRRQRKEFMTTGGLGGVTDVRVVITLSKLVRVTHDLFPFSNQFSNAIDSSIDSVIRDGILERGVILIMLNDLDEEAARQWAWRYRGFASISLFERRLLVKQKDNTLAARLLDPEQSATAKDLLDRYNLEFLAAQSLARHGFKRQQIADFLRRFIDHARSFDYRHDPRPVWLQDVTDEKFE